MERAWLALGVVLAAVVFGAFGKSQRLALWSGCDDDDVICKGQWSRAEDNETAKCVPAKTCFIDDDCFAGSCLGIAVGTCNCGACVPLAKCDDDSNCGGLKGACNNQTMLCDCDRGFKLNGFESHFDALLKFCNQENCEPNTDSCFGLPCNSGTCACF
uniref:Chondroitin proteoglycan 3 n=1 Tax=Ascaris lumbricoides TaxID=6252 RepID=A0A9J2Q433_ASCLU